MLPSINILHFVVGLHGRLRGALRLTALLVAAIGLVVLARALWPEPVPPLPDDGRPKHVLLIGVDGLSRRALGKGNSPTLDALAFEGAQATSAEAERPTMSAPNWASHLMGAGPRRHGVTANAWRPENWDGVSLCGRAEGAGWPSLIEVIETQRPDAFTAVIYDWIGIGRLVPKGLADRRLFRHWPALVQRATLRQLRRNAPLLTFVQIDHVDKAGHDHGFDSWQYHRAVSVADEQIAEMLGTLTEAELVEDSLVMVISDHGGIGRGHGGDSPQELEIPLILWGRGVVPELILGAQMRPRDTAPTIAYALGLATPDCWTGTAAAAAFNFQAQ